MLFLTIENLHLFQKGVTPLSSFYRAGRSSPDHVMRTNFSGDAEFTCSTSGDHNKVFYLHSFLNETIFFSFSPFLRPRGYVPCPESQRQDLNPGNPMKQF